jgi:hypothetical protein
MQGARKRYGIKEGEGQDEIDDWGFEEERFRQFTALSSAIPVQPNI